MNNQEMKKTAIKASVFALVSISLMLHRSATKHIMITDAAGIEIDRGSSESAYTLLVDKNVPKGKEDVLIIPLSKSVSSDNIVLEDDYVNHELRIFVDSREEGFYKDNAIVTDLHILDSAMCIAQNDTGSVCLEFGLDDLYVNESSLTESSTIEVRFCKPHDKYEHVVVVDAACGGDDAGASNGGLLEKDITVETALLLKDTVAKAGADDTKFYFTRQKDESVPLEKRAALIKDSEADLFVELSVDASEDESQNGIACYYNDRYFIRGLSNAEFADILERNCASKAGNSTIGVLPSENDELIAGATIPSARLSLGLVTGDQDSVRLTDEAYKTRAAEGIYSAISEALEVMR